MIMEQQLLASRPARGALPVVSKMRLRRGRRLVGMAAAAEIEIPQPMRRQHLVVVENDADAKPYVSGFKEGEVVPVPQSILDINHQQTLGYGEDLAEDHPGYHDETYKKRRKSIAELAKAHKIGEPLPVVEYSEKETEIWNQVLDSLEHLFPDRACKEYLEALSYFNFKRGKVPQLAELSEVITNATGWTIRPTPGLLHPRDFLNGLAFKTFHSTQYIRHGSAPMYTPEPDICHELIGHVPLLANPQYAKLLENIGLASLGASNRDIWHLTKVYWYTVEFGAVREGDSIKAFGAGILSSYGELDWFYNGDDQGNFPEFRRLNPYITMPKMNYNLGYQKYYYTLDSFEDGARLLEEFSAKMRRPDVAA